MKFRFLLINLLLILLVGSIAPLARGAASPRVEIRVDRDDLPMGHCVNLTAQARYADGRPAAGLRLLPYVNERRWGAHEMTDATGWARWQIPLPNPGLAEIVIEMRPSAVSEVSEEWMWARQIANNQTVYLARDFSLDTAPTDATLYVGVDDSCEIFLNGQQIGQAAGWSKISPLANLQTHLKKGRNTLALQCVNASGPAGVLVRLETTSPSGAETKAISSNKEWDTWLEKPAWWPVRPPDAQAGEPAATFGTVSHSTWTPSMGEWRGLGRGELLFAGFPLGRDALLSNRVAVRVKRREIPPPKHDPDHEILLQWEPWFTPGMIQWETAQAVPLTGFYQSSNRDIIRQQVIWMAEAGVNVVLGDWSNHVWEKKHWNDRPPHTNNILLATTVFLEELANLRDEGIPVPTFTLLPGLSNGPVASVQAINEQLDWIYHNYIVTPRFKDLWAMYKGKPLIVIVDSALAARRPGKQDVDNSRFTIRFMSSQLHRTRHNRFGYWSWMDGESQPVPTYLYDTVESLTVTPAFFDPGGWLYPNAWGRRGGDTYVETFKSALKHRPRFLQLHQWNEFAGQPNGQGYGPKNDIYYDTYSPEFSDDLEPVSLTANAYRGHGGWGFTYLNLTRAMVDVYHGDAQDSTILTVGAPLWGENVTGSVLRVEWSALGRRPNGFTVALDGRVLAEGLTEETYAADLTGLADGGHVITVTAPGATTRYPLSATRFDEPLTEPAPAQCQVPFTLRAATNP